MKKLFKQTFVNPIIAKPAKICSDKTVKQSKLKYQSKSVTSKKRPQTADEVAKLKAHEQINHKCNGMTPWQAVEKLNDKNIQHCMKYFNIVKNETNNQQSTMFDKKSDLYNAYHLRYLAKIRRLGKQHPHADNHMDGGNHQAIDLDNVCALAVDSVDFLNVQSNISLLYINLVRKHITKMDYYEQETKFMANRIRNLDHERIMWRAKFMDVISDYAKTHQKLGYEYQNIKLSHKYASVKKATRLFKNCTASDNNSKLPTVPTSGGSR